eukprot:Gregarina_sp_Poly_1__2798@NODE_177_length_11964_cov_73_622174_g157_i0_p4_GENE_NODE_177_length_11964_cov_73_622174_g157_i0NODE_177_length_11964_cov_73_622174_g157_i0_p4_ORF_typecomplete_len365_score20_72CPW_WPC/PF09717_10/3_2e08CPW_WPC/PF09717_10/0_15CPW_WPC/PF09717_10/3e08CPW_WPC/PF09717_10/0_00046_NODE_177_length_11964_cov_73_622174_g157_i015672661
MGCRLWAVWAQAALVITEGEDLSTSQDLAYWTARTTQENYTKLLIDVHPDATSFQYNLANLMMEHEAEFRNASTDYIRAEHSICVRTKFGCPLGWSQKEKGATAVCLAPTDYLGPCPFEMDIKRIKTDQEECNVLFPCESTLCDNGKQPRYDFICPKHWIMLPLDDTVLCRSSSSIRSTCPGTYDFGSKWLTYVELILIAPYTCDPMECAQDYRHECPEGWRVTSTYSCLSPDVKGNQSSDECLQTRSNFTIGSVAEKAAYSRRCSNASFPCITHEWDCQPDYTICPEGFNSIRNGCRLIGPTSLDCPTEINFAVMDLNLLKYLSSRCQWKFPCQDKVNGRKKRAPKDPLETLEPPTVPFVVLE